MRNVEARSQRKLRAGRTGDTHPGGTGRLGRYAFPRLCASLKSRTLTADQETGFLRSEPFTAKDRVVEGISTGLLPASITPPEKRCRSSPDESRNTSPFLGIDLENGALDLAFPIRISYQVMDNRNPTSSAVTSRGLRALRFSQKEKDCWRRERFHGS